MKKLILALLLLSIGAFSWNGFDVQNQSARLVIEEIPDVAAPDQNTAVNLTLSNLTDKAINATVKLHKFVDDWKAVGNASQAVVLEANSEKKLSFQIVSGPFVYNALYPVHAQAAFTADGQEHILEAVRIFKVKGAKRVTGNQEQTLKECPQLPVLVLQDGSAIRLMDKLSHACCAWNYLGGELHYKPVGWLGIDPVSKATMKRQNTSRKTAAGESLDKPTIQMHPPYIPRGGSTFACFHIQLPDSDRILLKFSHSQRDSFASEPQSDGITFRVWAAPDGQQLKNYYDKHANVRTWMDCTVDLTELRGQLIDLRLEMNAGPDNNTSVDSGFFGTPVLEAGEQITLRDILKKAPQAQNPELFFEATSGGKGWLDGWLRVSNVMFKGLEIDLDDTPLLDSSSTFKFTGVDINQDNGMSVAVHKFLKEGKTVTVTLTAKVLNNEAVQLGVSSEQARITAISFGPWRDTASQYIFGHGYVVKNPQPFSMAFGGHNVAASHCGIEFDNGTAILQAIDVPPARLAVNPQEHHASFHTKGNCTFTLVPAVSAFNAAVTYQKYADKKPAGAFRNLAGRFVFDIWGGTASSIRKDMETAVRYGLADSLLTIHSWQHWGYDYRLPDIWPPRESFGSIEEILALQNLCASFNIPWGLHDNYIDFYPDADDFSYRHIYFLTPGVPQEAWYNKGRQAQSYKFRPDHIMPFVQRNFQLMTQSIKPTHCFIDVFTSTSCTDYYDCNGNYHPMTETRKCWGEAFAWIRDYLGGNAPTTSEAGHDQLTGYLDGADCQWITITPNGGSFCHRLPCDNWERVPWADAANHNKFALIGAGYSTRYEGNRSPILHGINSDDYISMELLSAHNLMTDAGSWGYHAVRKYWLAQDFIRATATRNMVSHEFVDNDIQHQHVVWDNGAQVWVNRGQEDWQVNGHNLPPYGYIVQYPDGEVVLEKTWGLYREFSRGKQHEYYNARDSFASQNSSRVHAAPSIENFKYLGEGRISYTLRWDVQQPAYDDFITYVHFMSEQGTPKITFQDDHTSSTPTSQWQGVIRDERVMTIPESANDKSYTWVCGLHKSNRGRMQINGHPYPQRGVNLGQIKLIRNDKGELANVEYFAPSTPWPDNEDTFNHNAAGSVVDFATVKTNGVFRLVKGDNEITLVPAPNMKPFDITIILDKYLPDAQRLSITAERLSPEIEPKFTARREGGQLTVNLIPNTLFSITVKKN